jgi:hypothetical protein
MADAETRNLTPENYKFRYQPINAMAARRWPFFL